MDGRTHLAVGAAAGCVAGAVALQTQAVATLGEATALAGLWTGFSQFPDLDTSSHPQRWFYRGAAVLLLLWVLGGHWRLAAIAGGLTLMPLLQHHRGWTHRWWAALLVPLAALALWRLFTVEPAAWAWSDSADAAHALGATLSAGWPAYTAMAGGYATHLMLDRFPRRRR